MLSPTASAAWWPGAPASASVAGVNAMLAFASFGAAVTVTVLTEWATFAV